jgi:holin-like protein
MMKLSENRSLPCSPCCLSADVIFALLSSFISAYTPGMLILFALLASQILPVNWVKPGCHLLIRYMALLFVPISVGVMSYTDILTAQFGPIVVSCVVSTLLVLSIVGVSAHKLHSRRPAGGSADE